MILPGRSFHHLSTNVGWFEPIHGPTDCVPSRKWCALLPIRVVRLPEDLRPKSIYVMIPCIKMNIMCHYTCLLTPIAIIKHKCKWNNLFIKSLTYRHSFSPESGKSSSPFNWTSAFKRPLLNLRTSILSFPPDP